MNLSGSRSRRSFPRRDFRIYRMLPQDEVLQNSPMLRALRPFVPVKTRNWSAVFARSGHVSIFLAKNLPTCRGSSSSLYRYGHVDREIFAIGVAFVEKAF
jgi:hypothetical protein